MVRPLVVLLLLAATPAHAEPHQGVVLGYGANFPLRDAGEGFAGDIWLGWMVRHDLAVTGWAKFHALDADGESRRQLGALARWWALPIHRVYVEGRLWDDRYAAVSIHHGLSMGTALGWEMLRRRRFAFDLRLAIDVTTLDDYVDRNQLTLGFAATFYIATK